MNPGVVRPSETARPTRPRGAGRGAGWLEGRRKVSVQLATTFARPSGGAISTKDFRGPGLATVPPKRDGLGRAEGSAG